MIHGDKKTAAVAQARAQLRIVATTDLHVHLLPYDYYADRPAPGTGLANAAALIRKLRAEAANALLFDNGDFLQGTPLSDAVVELSPGLMHPAIAAMNRLGYDAATLGNHEFNYGLPYLERALEDAQFPVVSANLARIEGDPLCPPWIIIGRELRTAGGTTARIGIGVIGFAPPQVVDWDSAHLAGRIRSEDIVAAARTAVPALRKAGADIVIALCHSGIGAEAEAPRMENAAVPLSAVPGIDVVLAGHTHRIFPGAQVRHSAAVDPALGTLNGKPAVMAGFHGSHVGCIDLVLERSERLSSWRIAAHSSAAMSVREAMAEGPPAGSDAQVVEATAPAHRLALDHIRRPIGRTRRPIDSYFALVAPSSAVQVVADAQRRHVAEVAPDLPDLPILSAAAPFRAGGWGGPGNYVDIAAGKLALRNVADLYLYPNTISVLEIDGRALRDWLERSASLFMTIPPLARQAPLVDPSVPSYNFDVIDGLRYRIDVSRPPRFHPTGELRDPRAARIGALTREGRPVRDDDRFLVVTNSYRTGGGGVFRAAQTGVLHYKGQSSTRDALVRHLAAGGAVGAAPAPVWSFAPFPDPVTVTFDTGPGARDVIPPRPGRALRNLGPMPSGFDRWQLTL